ncbi:hypothetical protein PC39_01355 [Salinisphaera sp. PC39]|uniref:hypothetical protein n=1 Tax=Salinisphaera sp. PC39 TaxID=1304156 RepID=UPI0033425F5B
MQASTKARLKILAVALLFIGPLAAAWLLYTAFPGQAPGGRTHHGELNEPAVPLSGKGLEPAAGTAELPAFAEQWTFLQVTGERCGDACQDGLATTRQVRALLHRRSTRVQRVLVLADGGTVPPIEDHPDLAVYRGGRALRETLGDQAPGTVFVVDPLGNWVLTYPAPVDADGLFKDIKHLLKLSHIG